MEFPSDSRRKQLGTVRSAARQGPGRGPYSEGPTAASRFGDAGLPRTVRSKPRARWGAAVCPPTPRTDQSMLIRKGLRAPGPATAWQSGGAGLRDRFRPHE